MLPESKCRTRLCKHYRGTRLLDLDNPNSEVNYCKAFRDGIPLEISYGENDHLELTGGEYRELTFAVGTDRKLVKPYMVRNMRNPKLHGTDTLCSTLRDIYMRSTDEEVRIWARMAMRMSKNMMLVLYLYRDMLIEKGVDLKAHRQDWQFRGSIGKIREKDNAA